MIRSEREGATAMVTTIARQARPPFGFGADQGPAFIGNASG